MEWIAIGLIAWWWCASRSSSKARKAERDMQCQADWIREQRFALPAQHGPWVMPGVLMAITDDYAYWRAEGRLVRAPWHDGCADLDLLEPADPLECDDLHPALVVEILDALDRAYDQMNHPRG
jgi:hypothetical protein